MRATFNDKIFQLSLCLFLASLHDTFTPADCRIEQAEILASTTWNVLPPTRQGQEPAQPKFVESCCSLLGNVAENEISMETYSQLISNVTDGAVEPSYASLPLDLVAVFNVLACSNGRPCIGSQATIPVLNPSETETTCFTVEASLRRLNLLPSSQTKCSSILNQETNPILIEL